MKKKDLLIILLLLLLTLPSVLPMVHPGFFQTDDGEWMIIRLSAFYQALHDGQFPVRFLQRLNFGYGYPVAEFLYPGSFYFASLLHIIRFGFINSIKLIYAISFIGSALFSYLWLRKLFSRFPSFIGALVAVYIPYHLYDVYTRGTLEVFALVWVPFILWQIERKSILWTSVGIAFLILSHNTLAALFLPLIICYMLLEIYISKNKKAALSFYAYLVCFGLGLSAFFWLPIIFELQYTVFSSTVVSRWDKYFASFDQIGLIAYVILLMVIALFIFKKAKLQQHRLTVILFLFSAFSFLMATPISYQLWQILPVQFIQFPFRFLSLLVVTLAFLAAFSISLMKGKIQWTSAGVLLVLLVYSALPYGKPVLYFDKGEGYYYTNDATTTVQDEYMPVWVNQKPSSHFKQEVEIVKGRGTITNILPTNNAISFSINVQMPSMLQVNRVYWPGWKANVDGKPVTISYANPTGSMRVAVPQGEHAVQFTFGESPLRLFADALSIFAFFGLLFFVKKYSIRK